MKIVLTGSLGHISRPLAQQLLAAGHMVTVISHSAARAKEIHALGATPAIGQISDEAFLTATFTGADAVYLMITNTNDDQDIFAAGHRQATIYARAVLAAGVQHVVNLSSVGANLGPEVGALYIYHVIEGVLTRELASTTTLTFLRPTGMFYNLLGSLPSIKRDHAIYTNNSVTKRGSWVAPIDIVPIAAQALTAPRPGVTHPYIASDERSYQEIAALLGRALNLPDLRAIQIDDATMTRNLLTSGMPQTFTTQYVKMLAYERDSDFYADYQAHHPVLGPTKLTDFSQTVARAYHQL